MNEQELILALKDKTRRESAFRIVVDTYKEQLYWQIRHMVLAHDDADDILQNTFIKAWTGLESFRGDAKLSTWLYRIANNETLNHLERRKQTFSLDDEQSTIVNTLQQDSYFDGDETQLQLQQAISQLPDKQRMVFNMKYFQEMKYEEMSEILGTSIGALKASYHHAVKKITCFFGNID